MNMVLQLNCSGCAFVCEKKRKCWRPKCFIYPQNSDGSSINFTGQFCQGAQDLQVPAKLWRSAHWDPWAVDPCISSPEIPSFAWETLLGLLSALLKGWLVHVTDLVHLGKPACLFQWFGDSRLAPWVEMQSSMKPALSLVKTRGLFLLARCFAPLWSRPWIPVNLVPGGQTSCCLLLHPPQLPSAPQKHHPF